MIFENNKGLKLNINNGFIPAICFAVASCYILIKNKMNCNSDNMNNIISTAGKIALLK